METVLVVLVVVVASVIKGITGFGFALVALPLLSFWYPPKVLIPVLTLSNLVASFIIILQKKDRKLITQQFRTLIFYGAVFTIAGVLVLKYISDELLLVIMTIFFIIMSTLSLLGIQYPKPLTNIAYKIAGAFCGFLTGCISVSGPPLALFLNAANVDNQEFREIFSWFSIVTAGIALAGYFPLGMITSQTLKMTLWFLPVLFAGSYFGKRLNHIMPAPLFKKISLVLTLISSLVLLLGMK